MSRRSKRLGAIDLEDDRISTSSLESQHLYRDSPVRSTRRKVTTIRRVPPSQQTTEHTYYSETSSYYSQDKSGLPAALEETSYRGTTWGENDLVRKRMGTDISYDGNKNGFSEIQTTYDKSTSSSGYSSEEDNTSHSYSQKGHIHLSQWRKWIHQLFSYPGRVFGLLYWWIGTTWYRLTTAASLLDVFILTRHYGVLKKVMKILLLLIFLALMATGMWYFYPFGLQDLFVPKTTISGTEKSTKDQERSFLRKVDPEPQNLPLFLQNELVSRMESLEKRFQGLENAQKLLKHDEKSSKTISGLSRDEAIQVFRELSTSKEAALKEVIMQEGAARTKMELKAVKEEQEHGLQDIHQKINHMSKDIEGQIVQLRTEVKSSSQNMKEIFAQDVGKLETKLLSLQQELETLRKAQSELSQQVKTVPGQIREMKDEVQLLFPAWLQSNTETKNSGSASLSEIFLRRDELEKYLLELERKILAGVTADRNLWASQAHVNIDRELQASGLSGVSREEVYEIVNRVLQTYSEDRIGLVDYALESSGASVLNTRCSETYETKTALISLFGVPLWYQSQSPRVILQPDSNPGNCWAFRGSQGYAVIRLSSRIRPTAVTLDHIPRSLSPKSTIASAPKDFSVYGLEEETQKEGVLLGNFTYNQNGNPIQTFSLKGENISSFDLVELRIQSNWGHPEYTCIYRFRVHGETEP
ncbi:SUN domain-containing protein 2 isoform X1 [Bufo bufo]|uniref:SUN domain-containing protein 2 isoform X1 n=1 Tax=Bufo bufo TaxID=8384 RepID=UPI001ABDC63D|nr:SUN domain-containing protein 2 isoform X1 [Bufo bufo]